MLCVLKALPSLQDPRGQHPGGVGWPCRGQAALQPLGKQDDLQLQTSHLLGPRCGAGTEAGAAS